MSRGVTGALTELDCLRLFGNGFIFFLIESVIVTVGDLCFVSVVSLLNFRLALNAESVSALVFGVVVMGWTLVGILVCVWDVVEADGADEELGTGVLSSSGLVLVFTAD